MRILIFGPNDSGKGTQSVHLVKKYQLAHVESGGIFRENIKGGTPLGKEAKAFIDRGELVPDTLTIPMVLNRLNDDDCKGGWILDGFPRNPSQSRALLAGLEQGGNPLDAVIVIDLARPIAKQRLLGRRTCPNGHPNNTAIAAISPERRDGKEVCRRCGAQVTARPDDINEEAIDQRHDIYYDRETGTEGAITTVAQWAEANGVTFFRVNGEGDIGDIRDRILAGLS